MSPGPSLIEQRLRVLAWLATCVFALCFLRAVSLTIWWSDFLQARGRSQHVQRVRMPPERGPIVDRNGQLLAISVSSGDVYLQPKKFDPRNAANVAHALNLPVEEVLRRATSSASFVWLKRNVAAEELDRLSQFNVPGVGVEPARRRTYPFGHLAGQLLGTVGVDLQGLGGIEAAYDRFLRASEAPERVERDAYGRRLRRDGQVRTRLQPGARVELTIDASLQRVTEQHLRAAVEQTHAKQGLSIIIDPQTGEVLAMAHYPFFDPNDRSQAAADHARIRAITDVFEPGSTFKAFVAAAGIDQHVVRPEERLYCEGGRYQVGKHTVRDHEGYGWLTFADVIRHSSNICTAKVGERLGPRRLYEALQGFGFHRITDIDLPGEKAYPLRPWEKWARIHLVTTSFGQGVVVTPMQLVTAYAALANGGKLMRPYVVRRVVAPDGSVVLENRPHVVREVVSEETTREVTRLLELVVEGGTGKKARLEGIKVAGKTGTAQKVEPGTGRYSPRDRIASFIGYFPAEAPRYVILVVIDTPRTATYGGLVAAPVFKEIGQFVADRFGLRLATAPSLPPPVLTSGTPSLRTVSWAGEETLIGMPSFLGLSLREALHQARLGGWEVEAEGWGFVTAQDPPPGATSAPDRKLRLRLEPPVG